MKYCTIPGCNGLSWENGKCREHLKKPRPIVIGPTCSEFECEDRVYSRGLCCSHYHKYKRRGLIQTRMKKKSGRGAITVEGVSPLFTLN